jgi:glycosyltransferase involved in cell wall biosynthesis
MASELDGPGFALAFSVAFLFSEVGWSIDWRFDRSQLLGRQCGKGDWAMRILLVHNVYRDRYGEDVVVDEEHALLKLHGHAVDRHGADNATIAGGWATLRTAWQAPYSNRERDRLLRRIETFRPDVVHVHNFFPLLTPSVFDACEAAGVPAVLSVHNYRLVCPGATFFRAGAVCEKCLRGSAYNAARHGCYRGSRLGSLAVARMVERHRTAGTWQRKVDCFIVFTEFARAKLMEAGFPGDRIAVKPNAVRIGSSVERADGDGAALFVGRLAAEKGVATLLSAWRDLDLPLRIVGDGPLRALAQQAKQASIIWLGRLSPDGVAEEMRRARFLVMPSEWYEGFPLVVAEAMARGLPIIASNLGGLGELVRDGATGLSFTAGDATDLARAVRWARDNPEAMARMAHAARVRVLESLTPEANHRRLTEIYAAVLARRRGRLTEHLSSLPRANIGDVSRRWGEL